MYRNMAQLYRNNQIIDVTKECTFEWIQEPKSCYAFLEVSGASGDFTDGETVTGGTSNATATVFSSYVDGGRVYVENVSGTFQAGETITGSSSNQTATVDGFVPERSWTSTPNNITHGSFPDSIISKDIDDYLEFESSLVGAGYSFKLKVTPSEEGFYYLSCIFGVGLQVDSCSSSSIRLIRQATLPLGCFVTNGSDFLKMVNGYDALFANMTSDILSRVIEKNGNRTGFLFSGYQLKKNTFRWRIHNIRVLKLII